MWVNWVISYKASVCGARGSKCVGVRSTMINNGLILTVPMCTWYLDVELDVDHPDGPARDEAPDPDGGVLAAGDHQL